MSFLQLVLSLDKTFEEIILFWRICHLDIFTDMRLTDITTSGGSWIFTTGVIHPRGVLVSVNFDCFAPSRFPHFHCNAVRKAVKAHKNLHTIQQNEHT